jgi:hypothetical protein
MKPENRGGKRPNSGPKRFMVNKKRITIDISAHKEAEIRKAIKELNEYSFKD